jgi:hypothetical protein
MRAAAALDLEKGMRGSGFALLLLGALFGCGELPLAPQVETAGEPGAAVYTAGGALERLAYDATGRATYALDGAGLASLALSADFRIPAVPEVSVFLSNTPDLREAVKVAELGSDRGAQRWTFRMPRGAVWSWVVLWSEELGVAVARARLSPQ